MEAQVQNLRRWSQLIAMFVFVVPSAAFAENKSYDQALKLAEQQKWSAAHTAFEQAWNNDPDPSIAYSWCMAMHDAKDAAKKKTACALVDASKLDPARRKKFNAITAATPTPLVDKSTCKNNTGNCGNTNIDNSKTSINTTYKNTKTKQSRLTGVGYVGLGLVGVGLLSGGWLARELTILDDIKTNNPEVDSRERYDALTQDYRDAQWRGRFALAGLVVFGVGGAAMFLFDWLGVEETVTSDNATLLLTPSYFEVRW